MTGRPTVGEVAPGVFRFRRSVLRVVVDLVLAPIGAVAFLAMAWFMVTGAMERDPSIRVFALLPAFFGVILALGALITVRRGVRRTVFEVTPDGIWSPESGRLAWSEIAEMRLESMRGLSDGDTVATTRYLRVGVVPKDASLAARQRALRASTTLVNAFLGFVRRIGPEMRLRPVDLAPFGVTDYEIQEPIGAVIDAVRRYAPIVDADELRVRARAPMWAARAGQGPATPPIVDADLRAIDARLATGPRLPPAPVDIPIPIAPLPRAAFRSPSLSLSGVLSAIPRPAAFIVVGFIGATQLLSNAAAGTPVWMSVLLVVVPGVFVAAGLLMLRPIFAKVRRGVAPQETLAVGPDGIWAPGLEGRLRWADVAQVRTERAGLVTTGQGQVETWSIVVEPAASAVGAGPISVRSDELDAPFDDVLDLIRYYHPVVETG